MKRIAMLLGCLVMAWTATAQEKQQLKVLYVGGTSDEREATEAGIKARTQAFSDFLNTYFTDVTVISGKDYAVEMSARHDVTLFDGPVPSIQGRFATQDANGEVIYHRERSVLDENFAYPAMLLCNMGEDLGRPIGIKTDWYCLCLDADAHHVNTEHPIFKGPYKTGLTFTEQPTPEAAFGYEYFTGKLPATTSMWKVQTRGYITDNQMRIGMVSRPWGFADSPETEVISSGVCAKAIDAVAIGRHGNFFFWGFSASPKYMTDEAKAVFANAVVYTASLKGQHVLARKYFERAATREYLKEVLYLTSEEQYKERIEMDREWHGQLIQYVKSAKAKKERGEALNATEKSYAAMQVPGKFVPMPLEEYLKKRMGEEDFARFGTDVKAYHKYLESSKPYLYGARMFYKFILDEDCKSWKIANNDIRLLDKAITVLEKGKKEEEMAKARRVLDRYTLCTFTTPEEWREWFETYKDRLFFSESGGWVFLVNDQNPETPGNDYAAKAIHHAAGTMATAKTSGSQPVAIAAKTIAVDGGRQFVLVKMSIHPGYHIYGNVSDQDPFIATTVSLDLPEGMKQGTMTCPPASHVSPTGTMEYENEILYVIPVSGNSAKGMEVKVTYQCCDSKICFPPAEKSIVLDPIQQQY